MPSASAATTAVEEKGGRKDWLPLSLSAKDAGRLALVFAAYFAAAWFSLDLYFGYETSPALIWIPTGIAIAAVIFEGYRASVPIFLAHFLAILFNSPFPPENALLFGTTHALQAIAALAALRWFGFEPKLYQIRNMAILLLAAFVFTATSPLLSMALQAAMGNASADPVRDFGRAWGGFIASVFIITPLILTWVPFPAKPFPKKVRERIELLCAFAVLLAVSYVVFWTTMAQEFGVAVIFFIPAILAWFALRFPTRWMTLAIFLSTAFGIMGTIIAQASDNPLNEQLLAVELYMAFIAALYLAFVAIVEERRAAFLRLEALYQAAAAADADKNRFIAILAHELRNPLAPIVTSLELAKFEPQTPAAKIAIAQAEEHIAMIRRLLDDLLDVARLTQSRFKLHRESVRVADVVASSVAAVRELSHQRGIPIAIGPFPDDLAIEADPVRVKQIFINLLGNAVKYTERGGKIEISFEVADATLSVRVRDTGIGIEPEKLAEIFEPFKQASTRTHWSAGLGLGLYLSRELARMHGGDIRAESRGPGTGSTFIVTLPIHANDSRNEDAAEHGGRPEDATDTLGR